MTNALTYLYYIYDKFIDLVFNKLVIVQSGSNAVTFGWVCVGCLIFGVLFKSVLSLPRSAPTYKSNAALDRAADRQLAGKIRRGF